MANITPTAWNALTADGKASWVASALDSEVRALRAHAIAGDVSEAQLVDADTAARLLQRTVESAAGQAAVDEAHASYLAAKAGS